MRIGILGAGKIGGTLAKLLANAGHDVAVSNSRSARSLEGKVKELGPEVKAMTAEDAVRHGELVVLAMPLKALPSLRPYEFGGKIVVDAMNYYPERDGVIHFNERTSSELVARHVRGARVVKAFNTMNFQPLSTEGKRGAPAAERLALYVAGDDADAKELVSAIIDELGFTAVDTGPLAEGGRRQQPGTKVYGKNVKAAVAKRLLASG
jgi:8-hydroxy-5-deazaflavin:NADPH oxidoreductase